MGTRPVGARAAAPVVVAAGDVLLDADHVQHQDEIPQTLGAAGRVDSAVLGRLVAEAQNISRKLLLDGSTGLRLATLRAAGVAPLADRGAAEPLLEALRDSDRSVRWAAAEMLGRIAVPQAVPSLIEALRGPEALVQWAALEALLALGWSQPRNGPLGTPM